METIQYKKLKFPQHGDSRGHLVVVEGGKDVPFDIKRMFYIYGSDKGVVRGRHANRKSEFVLINVKGTSKVKIDTGKKVEVVSLDHPHEGIYLSRMVWKEMYDFSKDAVLLVLSNEHYDPEEYIRDYEQFLYEVNQKDV